MQQLNEENEFSKSTKYYLIYLELCHSDSPIITVNTMPCCGLYDDPEKGHLEQPSDPPTQVSFYLAVSMTVVVGGLSDP